jgi:mono/diheme cytochrome c family protein
MKLLLILITVSAYAQTQVISQGEKIFNQTCATGYCHAVKGTTGGGAPRLAARGFDEAYITNTTARGINGTNMPAFATVLSRADLVAVTAYVATLNGIANPNVNLGPAIPQRPALPPEVEKGRALFFDSVKGFGRCATCHEMNGVGIPVASPISKVPENAAALRSLATPSIKTATVEGDSMPALVVSQAKARTIFYDLTTAPPVQRTVDSGAAKITDGNSWKHADFLKSYTDAELDSVLKFLSAAAR